MIESFAIVAAAAGPLAVAVVAAAMPVPTFAGARVYRRFSDAAFRRLVLLLLTAAGEGAPDAPRE